MFRNWALPQTDTNPYSIVPEDVTASSSNNEDNTDDLEKVENKLNLEDTSYIIINRDRVVNSSQQYFEDSIDP